MNNQTKLMFLPTKLKYRLAVAFSLMSLLPVISGVYIASLFISYPFKVNPSVLLTASLVSLVSVLLSFIGYTILRQIMNPIVEMAERAQKIAAGNLEQDPVKSDVDEIQELSKSLRLISRNAKDLLDKVDKLSVKDKLTGLYNMVYMRERLKEEIQRAAHTQRCCSFALLSLDGFEAFEARCGAEIADDFQRAFANILRGELTEYDRAARVTQGEFALIYPDNNKKKMMEVIERLGKKVEALLASSDPQVRMSFAVGISENPMDGVSSEELIVKAQERARTAKKEKKLYEAFA